MTVSSSTDRATFLGNGVAQIFPLPFRFFANSEIQAWLVTNSTGALTALSLGTHYTLSGAGDPEVDGNPTSELTMLTAPTALQSLFVQRVIPATQPTDIVNQGRFFPEIHENVFDRLTMLMQQVGGEAEGAIRVAVGDPEPSRLVPAAQRANFLMAFDSQGNPIAVAPANGSASDLAMNLANTSDPAKGAGQIGRGGQVVSSIAGLRALLKTSASKNAFVAGYYAAGDGGGGPYYLDDGDTTSADNGGTIIVAADGGRWKIAGSILITPRLFGAKMDGVADDTIPLQAALSVAHARGLRFELGAGDIRVTATITLPSDRVSVKGSGPASRVMHNFDGPLFTSGAAATYASYHSFESFLIVSTSPKTSGAVCFNYNSGLVRSKFADIEVSRDAAGNEPWGFITANMNSTFDTISFLDVSLNQIVGVGYNIPKGSSLWFYAGRVIGLNALTSTATGIVLNGDMGGVWLWGIDLIQVDTGLWTTANNGLTNREIFITQGCADSCARWGYRFSDGAYISAVGIWAASCEAANIQCDETFTGVINISGGTIFNAGAYSGTGLKDGMVINAARRVVLDGIHFRNNLGYGLRCTTTAKPDSLVLTDCMFTNNANNSIGGSKVRVDGCQFEDNTNAPVINSSAGKCRITNTTGINDVLAVATPGMPASDGVITFGGYIPVTVYLAGGTVTAVRINGQQVMSSSNFSFNLAPGDTVSLTYSAAPTWTFVRADL